VNTFGPSEMNRLLELLADAQHGSLSVEEQAELDDLRLRATDVPAIDETFAKLIVMLDAADAPESEHALPPALRDRIVAHGERVVSGDEWMVVRHEARRRSTPWMTWSLVAALITITTLGGVVAVRMISERDQQLTESEAMIASLTDRVEANRKLLASVRRESQTLNERNMQLAEQLANVTNDLEVARNRIAAYEQPVDPEVLVSRRRDLMQEPDAVQVPWTLFDLGADNLAEQRDVTGDVVWSDSKQKGYLRFRGLDVNDPSIEQYQVWIIDERGMEQKVSGGVFDATSDGEIIVPIEPGIDVGRVQLFAVTIEDPGGIWVPDLTRRVTVASLDRS